MRLVKQKFESEFTINKSRFISLIYPLNNKEEVNDILKEVNKLYPKATHYCYAYIFDGYNKSNDDGEPASTAGKPILEVMLKQNINRAIIIVVRYFGGIKLGAGGLTRAYVQGAVDVLNKSEIYIEENRYVYSLTVDYSSNDILNNYLLKQNIDIIKINFDEEVTYEISSRKKDVSEITNYMQGKVKILFLEEKITLVKEK